MDANTQQIPMHVESIQSNEQAEKQLRAIIVPRLRLKGNTEEFLKNKLVIKQVEPNVFIAGSERIVSTFYRENWEMIMNLNWLRDEHYFSKASYIAGYREIPSDTGPVNLYRIQDIDNKGDPLPGTKPINKFSQEFYRAFMDIAFYNDRLILETFKQPDAVDKSTSENQRTFSKMDDKLLLSFTNWVMRIRDLVQLRKQGQISDRWYQSALSILQKNLLSVIGNHRFEHVNLWITREELDSYLKDELIDKALYTRAIQKLEQVEKIKRAVGEKHSEITNQTQIKTAWLMNESQNVA